MMLKRCDSNSCSPLHVSQGSGELYTPAVFASPALNFFRWLRPEQVTADPLHVTLRLFDNCLEPPVFKKLCPTTDLRNKYVSELARCTGHDGLAYYEQSEEHTRLTCADIDRVFESIDFHNVFSDDGVVNRGNLTVVWRMLGTVLVQCRAMDPQLRGEDFDQHVRKCGKRMMDNSQDLPYSYLSLTLYAHMILNHCNGWMSEPSGMYRWSLNSGEAMNQTEGTAWRTKSTRDGLGQDAVLAVMLSEQRRHDLGMLGLIDGTSR